MNDVDATPMDANAFHACAHSVPHNRGAEQVYARSLLSQRVRHRGSVENKHRVKRK